VFPLGGDKIFLQAENEQNIMSLFNTASEFFNEYLYDCRVWSKDSKLLYERGAWVRCYGIPLHAWNISFFALIASFIGRLLKVDECSVNKVRLDYARLFITTSSVKEINGVEDFYIDGTKFSIRLVEDLEFGLAEDACLVEYETDNVSNCSEPAGMNDNEPLVDILVDQLQEEWSKGSKHVSENKENNLKEAVLRLEEAYAAASGGVRKDDGGDHTPPPEWNEIMNQGPWSYNVCKKKGIILGEKAVSSSSKKDEAPNKTSTERHKLPKPHGSKSVTSLLNLKRIARLPLKDRYRLIRAIKKLNRKKSASKVVRSSSESKCGVSLSHGSKSSGSSTEYTNWLALHGKSKEVVADVAVVGKVMGVKVDVDCANKFDVLTRGKGEGDKKVTVVEGAKGPKLGEEGV